MADDEGAAAAEPAAENGAEAGRAEDDTAEPLEGEIVDEGGAGGAGAGAAGGGADPAGPAYGGAASHRQGQPERGGIAFGAVLVTVGAALLAGSFSDVVAAGGAPLVIGLGFFAWWGVTGRFGLLVPAGVLTGIGGGFALEEAVDWGNPVALGLGVGFVAIYLLALARRGRPHWWPLVPGVVLVVVGLLQNTSGWGAFGDLGWPLFLIVVGIIVLVGALLQRGGRR